MPRGMGAPLSRQVPQPTAEAPVGSGPSRFRRLRLPCPRSADIITVNVNVNVVDGDVDRDIPQPDLVAERRCYLAHYRAGPRRGTSVRKLRRHADRGPVRRDRLRRRQGSRRRYRHAGVVAVPQPPQQQMTAVAETRPAIETPPAKLAR